MKFQQYFNTDLVIGQCTIRALIGEKEILSKHLRTPPEEPTDWTVGHDATVEEIAQAAVALVNYFSGVQRD